MRRIIIKSILWSLLIATLVLGFSLIYFFGHFNDPITENNLRKITENIICLPAVNVFGAGYGGGEGAVYKELEYQFMILFITSFLIVLLLNWRKWKMK